jgi:hypothetical protein
MFGNIVSFKFDQFGDEQVALILFGREKENQVWVVDKDDMPFLIKKMEIQKEEEQQQQAAALTERQREKRKKKDKHDKKHKKDKKDKKDKKHKKHKKGKEQRGNTK